MQGLRLYGTRFDRQNVALRKVERRLDTLEKNWDVDHRPSMKDDIFKKYKLYALTQKYKLYDLSDRLSFFSTTGLCHLRSFLFLSFLQWP